MESQLNRSISIAQALSAFCGAPVEAFLTEHAQGAVVICPGGGYEFCSEREGKPVARRCNTIGLHAFVLNYTCSPAPLGNRPLNELAAAVVWLRTHAASLAIPSDHIAVCGFSAGAHLAASLGIRWMDTSLFEEPGEVSQLDEPSERDKRDEQPSDKLSLVERERAAAEQRRPNAMILGYPVITAGPYAHRSSIEQLVGTDPAAQTTVSLETFVTAQAAPAFLWHTADDATVPCQNSLLLVNALLQAGVLCEYHLYPHGVHGLSLATPEVDSTEKGRVADPHVAGWFDELAGWLATIW